MSTRIDISTDAERRLVIIALTPDEAEALACDIRGLADALARDSADVELELRRAAHRMRR
jgi:hypothetical protein